MENKTSKFAVASIVLGVLALVLFPTVIFSIVCGVLAIVFGCMAKNEVNGTNQSNKGLGIGGIVTGAVGLFLTLVFIVCVFAYAITGYSPKGRGYGYTYTFEGDINGPYEEFFDEYIPEIEG